MSVLNVVHPAFEIMKSDLDIYDNYLILERIIRTCYRSEGNITEFSHKKMIEKIIQFDHTAMIEHLFITVKLYIDRGVANEAVRHRLCSFAQSSTRYIDYSTGLNVVKPAHISMVDIEEICDVSMKDYPNFISQVSEENKMRVEEAFLFLNSCRTSFLNYLARISNGATRSQARGSLCHHTQAELVVTANLREWLHIFKLRDSKEAHQDFRLPIAGLRNLFAQKYPIIFNSSQIHPILFKKTFSYGEKYLVVPEDEGLQIESGSYKNHKETITIPVN